MKKFKFSLDTVLSYKQQVLEALQGEHALALAAVREQEALLENLWKQYRDYNAEYRRRAEEGLPLTEALMYQNGLRAAEQEIQRETRRLEELRAEEEKRREKVVEAKKDTSSIEKLREKKLDAYHKAEAKSEEAFIEEFVSTMRVNAANA
ncbi:flagellar export protein FliJ [Oscillibacter sp. 1-3]|uniref:flagellar export protein FliJ n=1 Tax=Oscillibacter sp. 1-3 TaxID=1235797 RepID=UPI00033FDC8F|nr:flagellar export protein FliJ [Oscillibacter sp. 1-3]EOS65135.1 flagellar export protein FliJ [Oscillibacter sp. 1-3]MCI9511614.1 flagellar export protein FliJ [Oscillibacter sp.]